MLFRNFNAQDVIISAEGKAAYARAVQVKAKDNRVVDVPSLDGAWASLEERTIDAVKQWSFKPALNKDGVPSNIRIPMETTFRLF